jgi:lipoate-protein ligase B
MTVMLLAEAGVVPYRVALGLQEAWARERAAGGVPDAVLLLEHPPVYTLGASARAEEFRVPRACLEAAGAEVVAIRRGGAITYHGPGQLIGYPVLDLSARGRDLHRYLRDLEEVLIRSLADFGVAGVRVAGATGVWVAGAKIASIGVGVRRWVSLHGFALNVGPDLGPFEAIVPCGLADARMTCLSAHAGREVSVAEVRPRVVARFAEVFGATWLSEGLEAMSARLASAADSPQSAQRTPSGLEVLGYFRGGIAEDQGMGAVRGSHGAAATNGYAVGVRNGRTPVLQSVSAVSAISAVNSLG